MNWRRYRIARNNVRVNQIYFQRHGRLPAKSVGRNRKINALALKTYVVNIDREISAVRLDRNAFFAANVRTMTKKRLQAAFKQKCISGDKLMAAIGMDFETAEHKKIYCRKWFASKMRESLAMTMVNSEMLPI